MEGAGEGKSLSVRLIGMGPEIPGHSFRADIDVNFVLKPYGACCMDLYMNVCWWGTYLV